jgi:hypothetical protein
VAEVEQALGDVFAGVAKGSGDGVSIGHVFP